jgi:hypothetical protein
MRAWYVFALDPPPVKSVNALRRTLLVFPRATANVEDTASVLKYLSTSSSAGVIGIVAAIVIGVLADPAVKFGVTNRVPAADCPVRINTLPLFDPLAVVISQAIMKNRYSLFSVIVVPGFQVTTVVTSAVVESAALVVPT